MFAVSDGYLIGHNYHGHDFLARCLHVSSGARQNVLVNVRGLAATHRE